MSDLPIYDFLEKIINKGLVDNNCFFEFGGGEPTLHFEFEKIMNLISSKLNPQINIYSSAIKYSPVIQTAIKNRNCQVVVSLDSGNSELYKKIKI